MKNILQKQERAKLIVWCNVATTANLVLLGYNLRMVKLMRNLGQVITTMSKRQPRAFQQMCSKYASIKHKEKPY